MRKDSLLSGSFIVIVAATLLVSSFEWKQENKSSVHTESRRQCEYEIFYSQSAISELAPTPIQGDENKEVTVTPIPYITGESKQKTKTFSSVKNKNRWNISLTNEEIDLLAKIVWLESRGESDEGQKAVIEVIFNRMIHWEFQGTLYHVLSKKNQFSTWDDRYKSNPTKKEYKNIKAVLNENTNILKLDTVYFSTTPRNNKVDKHIGGHWFCKYEYSNKQDKE